jgi:hypothetical protein
MQPPAVGPVARYSLAWGSWSPRSQRRELGPGHPPAHRNNAAMNGAQTRIL